MPSHKSKKLPKARAERHGETNRSYAENTPRAYQYESNADEYAQDGPSQWVAYETEYSYPADTDFSGQYAVTQGEEVQEPRDSRSRGKEKGKTTATEAAHRAAFPQLDDYDPYLSDGSDADFTYASDAASGDECGVTLTRDRKGRLYVSPALKTRGRGMSAGVDQQVASTSQYIDREQSSSPTSAAGIGYEYDDALDSLFLDNRAIQALSDGLDLSEMLKPGIELTLAGTFKVADGKIKLISLQPVSSGSHRVYDANKNWKTCSSFDDGGNELGNCVSYRLVRRLGLAHKIDRNIRTEYQDFNGAMGYTHGKIQLYVQNVSDNDLQYHKRWETFHVTDFPPGWEEMCFGEERFDGGLPRIAGRKKIKVTVIKPPSEWELADAVANGQ